jgi:hypothetical protein
MAIDYTGFAFAKSRPKALDKEDKDRALDAKDKAENAKARKRAKGQCEVLILLGALSRRASYARCPRKDAQTHHLKGGIGRRNRGDSILAIQKLRTCNECHDAITKNILQPTTATHDAYTVRYWRIR